MKRVVSFVMATVLCLSLCACGKSEEVLAVEEKISSIGEVSIEKADMIQEVNQAYEALSAEEQEKVENFDVLQKSMDDLQNAMFEAIALQCGEMNVGSNLVTNSVVEVWQNVGGEKFWTWYGSILKFADETLANMDVTDEKNNALYYGSAGYALGRARNAFGDGMTVEERQDVVDTCVILANTYYDIQEMNEQVSQDLAEFNDLFGEAYADDCAFLREWYLASSVFVEFATNPSGNRTEYSADLAEHNSTVYKFQKEAELMK